MGRRIFTIASILGLTAVSLVGLAGNAAAHPPLRGVVSIGSSLSHGWRLSCDDGARSLRQRGFSKIRVIACRSSRLVYHAEKHGQRLRIEVNARNGRVTHVDRVCPVRGQR